MIPNQIIPFNNLTMDIQLNDRLSELTFGLSTQPISNSIVVCPICGHEAGKHSHYGGKGCASCRAFFRRSVQNKSYLTFICMKDKNCSIDSKSWKSCRFCRFQKCLKSGMKPSWVLNEDERKMRHEKRMGNKPITIRLLSDVLDLRQGIFGYH